MFVPGKEADFREVMSTFAYELTHQWLEERCPLVGGDARGRRILESGGRGFWIVEGTATLVEELVFDLERRTARLRPRPQRTLPVAAAPEKVLLPWKEFFRLGHDGFAKLSEAEDRAIPESEHFGALKVAEVGLFYAQSCAVCVYLFAAEDGKHREELMEYVGAYYRGESPRIADYFGLTPAELGRRARAFAK